MKNEVNEVEEIRLATSKQTFSLFIGTGKCLELRKMNLEFDKASDLVGRMKDGKVDEVREKLIKLGATVKGEAVDQKPKKDWQAVYNEAHAAGMAAGEAKVPQPMVVVGGGQTYHVPSGVCGFAWIHFPGNCSFAKWAKKMNLSSDDYPTGKCIWVSYFNQSMEQKESYAYAFAAVLCKHGVDARARSRMD